MYMYAYVHTCTFKLYIHIFSHVVAHLLADVRTSTCRSFICLHTDSPRLGNFEAEQMAQRDLQSAGARP